MAAIFIPIRVMWLITNLAETNRTPFDFAEGESEIVSGFNIEYSAGRFALLFMAEYISIIVISLFTIAFFRGALGIRVIDDIWLGVKVTFVSFIFIWARGSFPRIRYDKLMGLT